LTSSATQKTPSKINNLQALRAFAALAVVTFHTGFIFPHMHAIGSCGVDVFFVLSGYIMARICEKNAQYFLRRRLIRIVPPYWLLTLLLFAVAIFVPDLLGSTRAHFSDLLKSLFFIPFVKESGLIRPLLFVGWSLNYEMFFYLLIWLSLLLLPKRPMLLAGGLVTLAHFLALMFTSQSVFARFLGEPFILEFPLGAIAYSLASRVSAARAERWRASSLTVLVLSTVGLLALQLFRPPMGPQLQGTFYSLLCMVIVLSTSLLSQGGWDTQLASLVLLGDASYILYLIHPYCEYAIQRVIVPRVPWLNIAYPLGCVVVTCIACATGLLLHLYGERPALKYLNQRFGGHRKSVEFGTTIETTGQVNP
jgi:exopolysaccharide production protein ExoZ